MVRRCLLLLWLIVGMGQCAIAHPTHTSFTTAEWNEETNSVELTVRMAADHLQEAIQRHIQDDSFRLEDQDAETSVRDYLNAKFRFSRLVLEDLKECSAKAELHWIGYELKTQDAWLYFEYPLPPNWRQLRLSNTLLFEVVEKQTNILSLHAGKRQQTFSFSADRPTMTLRRSDDVDVNVDVNVDADKGSQHLP